VHLSLIGWLTAALAVVGIAVQLCIVRVILNRGRYSEFSIFAAYNVLGVLLALIGLFGSRLQGCNQYFYIWWVSGVLYVGLEFGLLYEIFVNALKPYSALIDLGKMLFAWASVFLLIAATLTAFASSGSGANKITAAMTVVERTMRLIECGLLLLFFLFEKRLHLSWKNANIGIAIGLGVSGALDLAVSYLSSHYPWRIEELGLINSLAYVSILLFWTYCLSAQKKNNVSVLESPNRLIFQRWNEALLSYKEGELAFASGRVDSFLPGVERTVERVLARKMVN
jgi:hypothetical protein